MSLGRMTGRIDARQVRANAFRPLALRAAGLCLCALLCGCAAGQPGWFAGSSAAQPAAGDANHGAALAEFIGKNAPGVRGQVSDPVYGSVLVSVGEAYVSALGEACRKADAVGGPRLPQTEIFASCQGADGGWRLIAPVLPPVRSMQGQK